MKLGRNQLCPCGSGLKHKKCHGDQSKANTCRTLAQYMMLKLIMEARLRAKKIEQDEYDRLMGPLKEKMIEMILGEEAEPETEPAKLEDIQVGLERCAVCGGVITAGTECVKCKNKGGK